jgi:hypothetical protein
VVKILRNSVEWDPLSAIFRARNERREARREGNGQEQDNLETGELTHRGAGPVVTSRELRAVSRSDAKGSCHASALRADVTLEELRATVTLRR